MSVWVDRRAALAEPTFAAERKVWNNLVDDHKVVLTPGAPLQSCSLLVRLSSLQHQYQQLSCPMTA